MLKTKKTFVATLLACTGALAGYADEQMDRLEMRMRDLEAKLSSSSVSAAPMKGGRVFSKFDVEFYGQVYGSFARNSHGTDRETAPSYVLSRTAAPVAYAASEMGFTFQKTRFGFNVIGPEALSGKLYAKLELDMYGSTDNQGRLTPGIRHCYVAWDNESDWHVKIGQTTDSYVVVSPDIVNFASLARAGTIATRRMQVQVQKGFELNADHKLTARVAAVRGNNDHTTTQRTAVPHLQGALVYTGKWLTEKDTTLAVSGLVGKEKYSTAANGAIYKKPTVWLLMGSLDIPLTDWAKISGVIYRGNNLRDGGYSVMLNRYYVDASSKSIQTTGGWAQIQLTPVDKWTFNLGTGIESTRTEDALAAAGTGTSGLTYSNMSRNLVTYVNASYAFTDDLSASLEYNYMYTKYKGEVNKSTNHRVQAVVKFVF